MASFPALDLTWRSGIEGSGLDALHERLHAALDDFSPLAIHDHEAADGWRVFFRTIEQRDAATLELRGLCLDEITALAPVDVPDDEWARRSQANLTPIKVGRIVVTPPWHAGPAPAVGTHVIVIDPSTGFGTGHHETTRLCLALLQELHLRGKTVIDVGTGSGILAIGAAQLGASRVIAFDEDPEALRNARENVGRNDAALLVEVREENLATFDSAPGDVVVANITAAVLQRHAARLKAFVEPGGYLIASGFSAAEMNDVADAFGWAIEQQATEGDWAALTLRSTA